MQKVAAIIIAYLPEPAQLNHLIGLLAEECAAVFIMDNGGGHDAIDPNMKLDPRIQLIDMAGNQGLGAALNQGIGLAAARDFSYVTTFDQDSEPQAGQIAALVEAFESLVARKIHVAAVGPRIVDARRAIPVDYSFMHRRLGWPVAVTCSENCGFIEVDYLITSGSLISISAFHKVGNFAEAFFVDYTDVEWCFRASSLEFSFFGICDVVMSHELGSRDPAKILGMTILRYSPVRRYYYARNTIFLCLSSHAPIAWKFRLAFGLVARLLIIPIASRFSGNWRAECRMLVVGIYDGLRGIGGPLKATP
jgi:rhamnosyltransferase